MEQLEPSFPDEQVVSATEARIQMADLLSRVAYKHEPIILTRHGQPQAVLVSLDVYRRCQELLCDAVAPRPDHSSKEAHGAR